MQNEYQLRLKDLNYNEKLKEATEKFTQELDSDKKNYELLLQAKNDMEMEYEEKIKQLEERHQQQLQALEAQYQQKIMAEVARRVRIRPPARLFILGPLGIDGAAAPRWRLVASGGRGPLPTRTPQRQPAKPAWAAARKPQSASLGPPPRNTFSLGGGTPPTLSRPSH